MRHYSLVLYTDSAVWGGAERSAQTLVQHLSDDVDVMVIGHRRDVVEQVASRRAKTRTFVLDEQPTKRNIRAAVALRSLFRQLDPDVIQFNQTWFGSCLVPIACALGTRSVTVGVEQSPVVPTAPAQRHVAARLMARLDIRIAVGESVADEIARFLGRGAKCVVTIPQGVDASPGIRPERPTTERPVVASVGRLVVEKGLEVLLRAIVEVPSVRLEIIGDGPDRSRLAQLAGQLGVTERVRFAGWRDDPWNGDPHYDVFVLSSYVEGLPLALLEAMAAGVPVVATDVGDVAKVLGQGAYGHVIAPGDAAALGAAISDCLARPRETAMRAVEAAEHVRKIYSSQAMAERYEHVHRQAMSGRGHRWALH